MQCPLCSSPLELTPVLAVRATTIEDWRASGSPMPTVRCHLLSCVRYTGFYFEHDNNRCDYHRVGQVISGTFIEDVTLLTLTMIFERAAQTSPPEQDDLSNEEHPKHDPGE